MPPREQIPPRARGSHAPLVGGDVLLPGDADAGTITRAARDGPAGSDVGLRSHADPGRNGDSEPRAGDRADRGATFRDGERNADACSRPHPGRGADPYRHASSDRDVYADVPRDIDPGRDAHARADRDCGTGVRRRSRTCARADRCASSYRDAESAAATTTAAAAGTTTAPAT